MIEKTNKEIAFDGLNMTWKVYEKTQPSEFSQHFHNYYELIYFIKAQSDYVIENNVYPINDGDIILIAPGKFHMLVPSDGKYYERIVFHFSPQALFDPSILLGAFEKAEFLSKAEYPNFSLLMEDFTDILTAMSDEHIITLIRAKLTEFLTKLLYVATQDQSEYAINDKICGEAIKYIADNLASIQHVDDVANALFISRSTLQHTFKTNMQIPIMQYVRNKKVVLAKTLIQNGMTPSDAANVVGFTEYSTFFRTYKKYYGHTPKNER